MQELSPARARRIALTAQGFADPRPTGRPDRRHLRRVLGRTGLFQLDSVNVLVRSHYLPLYSRLGPYPRDLLDRAAYADHELFEYWGHEASLLPVELHPLLRWRMARAQTWKRMAQVAKERPEFLARVLAQVSDAGPLGVADLVDGGRRGGSWWGWSDGKNALEWLFWTGQVTTAGRRGFERLYDLPERVLPAAVLAAPTPTEEEAHRGLLRVAARALGVATALDLADYFRLKSPLARPRIAELVESGELVPVSVWGWRAPAYLDPGARVPHRVDARALLSPFDSLVWERDRTERLFGFRYRIEIYVPAARRLHGYYVLPFLLGDRLVARVDLKSDRAAGTLLVQAVYAEPGADPAAVASALAVELRSMAGWLGLDRVAVTGRGDLAPGLARALGGSPG
ncbi:MAG: winged helix DNA-binding domain-containing protein [Actinomycetota bacterium]|nr:winged helix DNA-binding domain-containing protein [Actinomycetota bacterium]